MPLLDNTINVLFILVSLVRYPLISPTRHEHAIHCHTHLRHIIITNAQQQNIVYHVIVASDDYQLSDPTSNDSTSASS